MSRSTRNKPPAEKGVMTRNSPCPISGHFHNVRYCPHIKKKAAEMGQIEAEAQKRLAALQLASSEPPAETISPQSLSLSPDDQDPAIPMK